MKAIISAIAMTIGLFGLREWLKRINSR